MLGAGLQSHPVVRRVLLYLHFSVALPFFCEILSQLMSIMNLADEDFFLKATFCVVTFLYLHLASEPWCLGEQFKG